LAIEDVSDGVRFMKKYAAAAPLANRHALPRRTPGHRSGIFEPVIAEIEIWGQTPV
jgi:hypothetical protein